MTRPRTALVALLAGALGSACAHPAPDLAGPAADPAGPAADLAGPAADPAGPAEAAPAGFSLSPGDLLFQDLDCGPTCDAIETVTHGWRGAKFSHIGLVVRGEGGGLGVLESLPPEGVVVVGVERFLGRSVDAAGRPRVVVGRLEEAFRPDLEAALARVDGFLGKAYDDVYVHGDDRYYCSELLEALFAGEAKAFFGVEPMTFDDPATGAGFPVWEAYFAERGSPVPEGEPGLNPAGISRSDRLRIVHQYGDVAGCPLETCAPERRRRERGAPRW